MTWSRPAKDDETIGRMAFTSNLATSSSSARRRPMATNSRPSRTRSGFLVVVGAELPRVRYPVADVTDPDGFAK